MGQSTNDVFPSATRLALLMLDKPLTTAAGSLSRAFMRKQIDFFDIVKVGRTHLQDAVPIRLGQEFSGYSACIGSGIEDLHYASTRLLRLNLGGTAVGTGLNAGVEFAVRAMQTLSELTERPLTGGKNFEVTQSMGDVLAYSGAMRRLAVEVSKIASDLRLLSMGPRAGIAEVQLPAVQPGSSIMPGKVNPVIPEAVAIVCAQVFGNHATITFAGASGNFQLNVMLPVIAHNLLQSIELLASSSRLLADRAIAGFKVRRDRLDESLARNPILVTALNPVIGYEAAAKIAKRAYKEGRPVLEVAKEMTKLSEKELRKLLDPNALTKGGIG
jgi:fumarate hydratase class II